MTVGDRAGDQRRGALLVQTHRSHDSVVRWWAGREVALSGHATVETYSVLTRLPSDVRLAPAAAARPGDVTTVPRRLAETGIAGGAAYDALVALAAAEHDIELATRDARAKGTYEAVGVRVVVVA